MLYKTRSGVRLEIGRIPRRLIDEFARDHPRPDPPLKQVEAEVFGQARNPGIREEAPDPTDPEYLLEMQRYYLEVGYAQIDLIIDGVTILDEVGTPDELEFLGFGDDKGELLRSLILDNQEDLGAVVAGVLYESTVTQQGIDEAARQFGVSWYANPVDPNKGPKTPAMYLAPFGDRKAARDAGYKWSEFIELSGPEQSAIVAFHRLDNRLAWLMAHK